MSQNYSFLGHTQCTQGSSLIMLSGIKTARKLSLAWYHERQGLYTFFFNRLTFLMEKTSNYDKEKILLQITKFWHIIPSHLYHSLSSFLEDLSRTKNFCFRYISWFLYFSSLTLESSFPYSFSYAYNFHILLLIAIICNQLPQNSQRMFPLLSVSIFLM